MRDIEFTVKEYISVAALIKTFTGRLGYPPNDSAMQAATRGLLRIVHLEPREWMDENGEKQTCQEPARWLVETAYATIDNFPSIFALRRIYEQRFTPRDGKCSWEMIA